eukprot:SAG11_NODE_2564_length_3218_cov_2.712408_1_plen_58_part_00
MENLVLVIDILNLEDRRRVPGRYRIEIMGPYRGMHHAYCKTRRVECVCTEHGAFSCT